MDPQVKERIENAINDHSITTLNLWHNNIGDRGCEYLAEMLQMNHSITTLFLGSNKIGASGCEYLVEMLKTNHSITTLYLSYNYINYECRREIDNLLTKEAIAERKEAYRRSQVGRFTKSASFRAIARKN